MSVLPVKSPENRGCPGYWAEFDDIPEKDSAKITRFRASDGYNLTMYEFGMGNRASVVIVNALATPFLLMAHLADALAERYHVVSWENRGGPFLDDRSDAVSTSLDRQAQDFIEIVMDRALAGFHAVALCTGAPIIALAASQAELPINSVSLFAPSGAGVPDHLSQYQEIFAPMIVEAGTANTAEARRIAQALQDYVHARHVDDGIKGEVSRLTYLNMRDIDGITGFARLMAGYWAGGIEERLCRFDELCRRHPVMIMHALDDPIVHYSASVKACERIGRAKLMLYPTGGHFKLCEKESETVRDILAFMAVHDGARPSERRMAMDWPALKPGTYLGPLWAVDWA